MGQGDYTGTIHFGDQQFPLTAHGLHNHLDGSFPSNGNRFTFTADLQGDALSLSSGGTTYAMQRTITAANPLAGAAPDNPIASSNYTVLASNDSGKALFVVRADIKTAQDALQCAMSDLARLLDGKPTIVRAFADSQGNNRGMASFTGVFQRESARGFILCGVGDNGAAISVIFAKDNAPRTDVLALVNAMPSGPKLSTVQLPGNLGTVQIADGWKITYVGPYGNVKIAGPAGQTLDLGDLVHAVPPNSPMAQK